MELLLEVFEKLFLLDPLPFEEEEGYEVKVPLVSICLGEVTLLGMMEPLAATVDFLLVSFDSFLKELFRDDWAKGS